MARGTADEAKAQLGTDNTSAATAQGNAAKALSSVQPYFQKNLTNPTGYSPSQMADMLTSSSQSLGGSQASAVGAGNLMAARTRNAAGYASAMDDAARGAMQQQSTNALKVNDANAQLQQQKQTQAAAGLSGLYGTGVDASLKALGLGTDSINAQTQADNNTLQSWLGPMQAAAGVAGHMVKPV